MPEISAEAVYAARLERQRPSSPVTGREEYLELFRMLQPVMPIYNSRPGDPPRLVHRATFDDGVVTDGWRAHRRIVKGRFLGGSLGYVLAQDLEIYANAFRRPLSSTTVIQQDVLEVITRMGQLTPRQIKEETGYLSKFVGPALERLQEAFLVYEDQVDSDWERGWYEFSSEWPDVNLSEERREEAMQEVVLHFLRGHVFATLEQVKDWSGFPSKTLAGLLKSMEQANLITPLTVEGLGEGWICAGEEIVKDARPARTVFMLHKADPLVRSHASELKRRFGPGEVLQYLLIDGAFKGAVMGHWRIGPHYVDDILLELPQSEKESRKEAILAAVTAEYPPPEKISF